MEFNIADLLECVADAVPAREAVVCGNERRTYGDLDARATRLAHAMRDAGVGIGEHVGLYLRNSVAHLETMLACYKARVVPINVNVSVRKSFLVISFEPMCVPPGASARARSRSGAHFVHANL